MRAQAKKTRSRRSTLDGGHTAQYITLAEGLRQIVEAMEVELAYLEKKGNSLGIASLRIEARCATVAVLSAALCECVANTVLAGTLTKAAFKDVVGESMPQKWNEIIPEVLGCPAPDPETMRLLRTLQTTRNSIVHAKATVFDEKEAVHIQGNDGQWINLTPEMVRKFQQLPLRLAENIPPSAGILSAGIISSLRDRQPRLPRVHVAEVLTALELLPSDQRQVIRAAIDRLEKADLS